MFRKFVVMALTAGVMLCAFAGCGKTAAQPEDIEDVQAPLSAEDSADSPTEDTAEEAAETTLTFIGHASVKLKAKDGTVIFIDPQQYSPTAYDDEADFILVTHGHGDHTPGSQVKLKESGRQITWKEALIDGAYQTFEYENVKIEAVKMGGNSNHAIGSGVGFIVTIDGISVYHAGDSSNHEELHYISGYDIDYAMYPIDGVYNMGPEEATELADIIGARCSIPIHASNTNVNIDKRDRFTPASRLLVEDQETIVLTEK